MGCMGSKPHKKSTIRQPKAQSTVQPTVKSDLGKSFMIRSTCEDGNKSNIISEKSMAVIVSQIKMDQQDTKIALPKSNLDSSMGSSLAQSVFSGNGLAGSLLSNTGSTACSTISNSTNSCSLMSAIADSKKESKHSNNSYIDSRPGQGSHAQDPAKTFVAKAPVDHTSSVAVSSAKVCDGVVVQPKDGHSEPCGVKHIQSR